MESISPKKQLIYDICIVVSILATAGITYLSLTNGIFDVFPYLYLIPVVLIAFARPKVSIYGTVLVGWLYLALVFLIGMPTNRLYTQATIWFYVFVSIGVLISIYSQVYRREEDKNYGMYHNSQAGAFTLDKKSLRIKDPNQKFSEILHYEQKELGEKTLPDLIPDFDERRRFLASIENQKRTGDIEARFRTADGSERWALVSAVETSEPSIICTLVDITDNKLVTEALSQANKKINLLNSVTRHDILNQLTALLGYLDLTRLKITDPQTLRYIEKEELAANAIRKQILFTRDYQNIGYQTPNWHNIPDTVSRAFATLDLHGVRIYADLPPIEVYADPMFEHVFYNLIENSIRHGERLTKITLHSQETLHGINLILEDDGVGIPETAKEKIFRREYFKNTGFGLFLSREILSITNLTISETGTPGEGARFVIHVPKGMYRPVLVNPVLLEK
ncbi:MAG: PAS domain-containing sensor histidine kinase [Methanoregula sp.]|nr:PAS domain-containing sensor histidine kinase [Methanoregula sp.]